eukprot:TRINITY_DN1635_c0_g2_i2.p1 TRINITY_DN1635_c0_g2~~TRINITY_DN1635_c0_g2_i2.p1  ORF type:complete len:330 (+),score=48.50 TRINITY_DN1635_c0_g2_i2:75-1064(+)
MSCVCVPHEVDGWEYWPWIAENLHQCAYTPSQVASVVVGLLSVCCWAFSQIPQLYTTYQVKSVDSISSLFLVQWLLGDLANLLGSILTNQLPTQIWIASYFSAIDIVWISQYLYYSYNRSSSGFGMYFFAWIYFVIWLYIQSSSIISPSSPDSDSVGNGLVHCQPDVESSHGTVLTGRILGWMAAFSYFISRMPQIWLLYKTHDTKGLSQMMFVWAALGNLTYGLSIVLWDYRPEALHESLPWLIGSIGTVQFDIIVLLQILYYTNQLTTEVLDPHIILNCLDDMAQEQCQDHGFLHEPSLFSHISTLETVSDEFNPNSRPYIQPLVAV